jgi:phosphohistidine phosphatase SixA
VLAGYVAQHQIRPELILCSSTLRTRDTLAGVLPGRAALIEGDLFVAGPDELLHGCAGSNLRPGR